MMIKTLDNVYINMEDFSGFTIGYPNDSDFTVMAMKELVDNQTATIELGRYPSEKEAKDALKKMIEHQDDIKKAEFFGREEGFYYISNVFTMPKPSKNGKADVKRFMIEGREYTVPLKVINEIYRQDMIDYGENIAENREVTYEMLMIDSNWKGNDEFYYTLASMVENYVDSTAAEDKAIDILKRDVKKKQEEKMLREKENFVVKYLLEFAAPEERNKFMGKNPNNVCLYDESEIRDVIAQMPEDIFLDFYGTFKFLYDENETSQEGK